MKETLNINEDLAEKLGYYAMYGFVTCDSYVEEKPSNIEGWTLISADEEGQKYGYFIHAIFHREGDPEDKAWETTFDVQSENEIFISGNSLTLYARKKVVKLIEVVTWE